MRFVCANCGQKFKIADETDAAFEFTCPSCCTAFKASIAEEPVIVRSASPEVQPSASAPVRSSAPVNAKLQLPDGRAQLKTNFMDKVGKPAKTGPGKCSIHPDQTATGVCGKCNAPICNICIKSHGYFCGKDCLDAMIRDIDAAGKAAKSRKEKLLKTLGRTAKWTFRLALLALIAWTGWWIWILFFDPAGKVAWQLDKSINAANFHIIDNSAGKLIFINKDTIITLDAGTGAETASYSIPPELADYSGAAAKILPDKILLAGEDGLAAVSRQGRILWKTKFSGENISQVKAGGNVALLTASHEDENSRKKKGQTPHYYPEYIRTLVALSLNDGRILWKKELGRNDYFYNLCVGDKYFACTASNYDEKVKDSYNSLILKVVENESGQDVWQIKLKQGISWGPRFINDFLVFKLDDNLHAVQTADGKKIWSLQIKGAPSRNYLKTDEDDGSEQERNNSVVYFLNHNDLSAIDLINGRVLWSRKLPDGAGSVISSGAERLYVRCQEQIKIEDGKEVKLPPAYEDLKKGDPVMESLQGAVKGDRFRVEDAILCLDAHTGGDLWKCDKVYGDLVADNRHAVLVRDTALTSRLGMMSASSDGDAVIEQLNLSTGKRMFVRKDAVGVAGPYVICGDKVIGLKYNRREGRPGTSGSTTAVSRHKELIYPGLVAFNLK
ncbi:MAG: PQQ-binding-like beta-propeller repeat protein [Victivallaceae bacterium]|jgi:outer membrane protein assembly factor BamB